MFHGRPGRIGGAGRINNAPLSIVKIVAEIVTVPLPMLEAERGHGRMPWACENKTAVRTPSIKRLQHQTLQKCPPAAYVIAVALR